MENTFFAGNVYRSGWGASTELASYGTLQESRFEVHQENFFRNIVFEYMTGYIVMISIIGTQVLSDRFLHLIHSVMGNIFF